MGSEIYKILYVENNAERVTQFRQLIRAHSIDSKITFDVSTTDSVEGISVAISKNDCDLVVLQDSPKVPILNEVIGVIGVKTTPIFVLINEEQFVEKREIMLNEGAVDVGILQQGDALFKQMVRAIFEFKTQLNYRDILEKNAKLTEMTAQLASVSEDLIAYFGAEDGLFLYANEAFLQFFGLKDFNDLAATTVVEYIPADESAQFKKMMKIVSKTGKEQKHQFSLKAPGGELIPEELIIKQGMHDETMCLELLIVKQGDGSSAKVVEQQVEVISEQAMFYDRLSFIDKLSNFVGSSSWMVCLVLQDYFTFRKEYGVDVLESYFLNLSKHLKSQISNLHYVRYSDDSIVLLLTNSDMTKVDRLGMAIVSSSEGYIYQANNETIQGKFTFAYTNLGDSVESITDACNRLDELSGLLDSRVVVGKNEVAGDDSSVQSISDTESSIDDDIEEEYMPLYNAFQRNAVKQIYIPVVDFSLQGQENYIASFNLYDEADQLIVWNKSFTYTSNNSLMRTLDLFMIETALKRLDADGDVNKKYVMIPLSMYFLQHVDQLIEWIKQNDTNSYFASKHILLGLAEEVIDENFEQAKLFFEALHKLGYHAAVYDIVDVTSTKVLDLDITLIALSENCISRMSRSISSDEMIKLPKLLEGLSQKGANMLATGVNSPTSMTLVWEYNIPYACGNMIGSPIQTLNFDFSQTLL